MENTQIDLIKSELKYKILVLKFRVRELKVGRIFCQWKILDETYRTVSNIKCVCVMDVMGKKSILCQPYITDDNFLLTFDVIFLVVREFWILRRFYYFTDEPTEETFRNATIVLHCMSVCACARECLNENVNLKMCTCMGEFTQRSHIWMGCFAVLSLSITLTLSLCVCVSICTHNWNCSIVFLLYLMRQ